MFIIYKREIYEPAHLNLQPPALNGGDWKSKNWKCGTVKNAEVENASLKNATPVCGGAKCETEYYETPVTITDSGNVVRMITMNFYAHDSKISTINLYSKWNVQIT